MDDEILELCWFTFLREFENKIPQYLVLSKENLNTEHIFPKYKGSLMVENLLFCVDFIG